MNVDRILDRLDAVRRSGDGWSARCPAHDDRGPSLSIGEGHDGRVLLHCFGGCDALSVLQALGLDWPDVFPERIKATMTREQRAAMRERWRNANLVAAINVLDREATVVAIAAGDVLQAGSMSPDDYNRLQEAVQAIGDARAVINAR